MTPVSSGVSNINTGSCLFVSRIYEAKTASQIIEDIHVLKVIKWLQTACESVSTETIKQCFKKRGLDIGYVSHKRKDGNTEFQKLFPQTYCEITLDKCISFDVDTITSETAADSTYIDC